MSNYKVSLKIEDTETGVESVFTMDIDVQLAPSGLYIATSPNSNGMSSGKAPIYAILDHIGNVNWDKTIVAEKGQEEEVK